MACLLYTSDVGGDDLARFPVHNVHDPTDIARFAEVLPVIVGEFVFLVLIQLLLLADEVRHEADVSPVSYTHLDVYKRQPSCR